VVDILGSDSAWIAVWAVGGAIIAFAIKVVQSLIVRDATQAAWPSEKVILAWVAGGTAAAFLGLFLGANVARASSGGHEPMFPGEMSMMFAVISCGLIMTGFIGLVAGIYLQPKPQDWLGEAEPIESE